MNPNVQDVRQEEFLQQFIDGAMQPDNEFIHDRVFPVVPVTQITGLYHRVPRGQTTRTEAKKRALGVPAPLTDFKISRERYVCTPIELATPVFDDFLRQAPNELLLEKMAIEQLGRKIKLKREELWDSVYMREGVWSGARVNGSVTDLDLSVQMLNGGLAEGQFDVAGSNPQISVNFAQRLCKSQHGLEPRLLIVGESAWAYLKTHPMIKDEIKYSQSSLVLQNSQTGKQLVAQALGVDEILVQSVVIDRAAEGQASNPGFIDHNAMLLVYKSPAPSIMTTSAGYTFEWTGDPNATGGDTGKLRSWREEPTRCRIYEAASTFDFKIVSSDCGVYIKNVLANPPA